MTSFLTYSEIQQQMRVRWADALSQFPEFETCRPSKPGLGAANRLVDAIESEFGTKLPLSFCEAAAQWDLGRLELACFGFARDGDYLARLVQLNAAVPGLEWWGDRDEAARPVDLLAIAHGDPFMVLLNTESGEIFAHAVDDGSANTQRVAPSLELFLRAAGTCNLGAKGVVDLDELSDSLVAELGSPYRPFWRELAAMWA